jgi:hypothetical protein
MKSSKPDTRGYIGGGAPQKGGLGPMRQAPAGKPANDTANMKGMPRQVGVGREFPGVGKPSIKSLSTKTSMGKKAMARTVKG